MSNLHTGVAIDRNASLRALAHEIPIRRVRVGLVKPGLPDLLEHIPMYQNGTETGRVNLVALTLLPLRDRHRLRHAVHIGPPVVLEDARPIRRVTEEPEPGHNRPGLGIRLLVQLLERIGRRGAIIVDVKHPLRTVIESGRDKADARIRDWLALVHNEQDLVRFANRHHPGYQPHVRLVRGNAHPVP